MKIITSYAVELKRISKMFNKTVTIYNEAVSFCCEKFLVEWDYLSDFSGKQKNMWAERLIHSTKGNVAKYDFDDKFHKMPTYLRRAAIAEALGAISSYKSSLENWEQTDKTTKPPTFNVSRNSFPTFYRDNMYLEGDNTSCQLKLFIDNDWKWLKVTLKKTDMQYIQKHCYGKRMSAPTLEKRHKKYFLRFTFEEDKVLKETPLPERLVCAVDLGINTDATCCIMDSRGTILKRKFINFSSEKDLITHGLNKIKKVQQKYGSKNSNARNLWRRVDFYNKELSRKVAKAITNFAAEHQVDVIVFEHLDMKGKKKGRSKQKLQMWKKNYIQELVTTKAHMLGIKISRICAWRTSKLAFDGSGSVLRGNKVGFNTYELCKFASGKIYNCDLSASYNIGARYFIREIEKSIPVKEWCRCLAKVPDAGKRTTNTLDTLIRLQSILSI